MSWWDFHQGDTNSGPPRWICTREDDFNFCDWDPPVAGRAFTAGEIWGILRKHGGLEVKECLTNKAQSVLSFHPKDGSGHLKFFPHDDLCEALGRTYLWFLQFPGKLHAMALHGGSSLGVASPKSEGAKQWQRFRSQA